MKRILMILTAFVVLGVSVLATPRQASAFEFELPKVYVCHNPGEQQETLHIAITAVPGHLVHNDYLGQCQPWEPQESPSPTPSESPEATIEPTSSPEASPSATPEETTAPVVVDRGSHVGSFIPACSGQWAAPIPWAYAQRSGTDATIHFVPTANTDAHVNVVFSENPFEVIFNLGSHGLRDWTPNNGVAQLHNLVKGRMYWFRIQNACSPWSSLYTIPAN